MPDPDEVKATITALKNETRNVVMEERILDAADDGTTYGGLTGPFGPTGAAGPTGAGGATGPTGPAGS